MIDKNFANNDSSSSIRCVVCNSHTIKPSVEKYGVVMRKCRRCGAVFTYPLPDFDTISSRYSEDWFEKEYLPSYGINPDAPSLEHLEGRFGAELNLIEPYKSNFRVLDVGAGAGLFLFNARKRGWETFGVELSGYGPSYAKKHFNLDIFRGTLEEAGYSDMYFDAVMLQDTIEHVPNPNTLVGEISRILRPGGALVLSTPNISSLGMKILQSRWSLISPSEHLCLFSAKTIKILAKKTGFIVKDIHTTDTVSTKLVHEDHTPNTHYRKAILKRLVKYLPSRTWKLLKMGDELHAVLEKKNCTI